MEASELEDVRDGILRLSYYWYVLEKSSHVATIFSIHCTHELAICYSESIFHSLIQVLIQLVTIVHNLGHPF